MTRFCDDLMGTSRIGISSFKTRRLGGLIPDESNIFAFRNLCFTTICDSQFTVNKRRLQQRLYLNTVETALVALLDGPCHPDYYYSTPLTATIDIKTHEYCTTNQRSHR